MSHLDNLFDEQQKTRGQLAQSSESKPSQVFVYFELGDAAFAVPADAVRELADSYSLSQYPEPVCGHLGIVSLRGKVMPVVCAKVCNAQNRKLRKHSKLMVLEFVLEEVFCIEVDRVKKLQVPLDEIRGSEAINVQGSPVRIVGREDLFPESEAAA